MKLNEQFVERYNDILACLGDGKTVNDIQDEFKLTKNQSAQIMHKLCELGYATCIAATSKLNRPCYQFKTLIFEIKEEDILRQVVKSSNPHLRYIPERHPERHPMDKRSSPKVYVGCSFEII